MYSLVRPRPRVLELAITAISLGVVETTCHFHSFTLEALAFCGIWYGLAAVADTVSWLTHHEDSSGYQA